MKFEDEPFDPEVLDKAFNSLVEAATTARNYFLLGNDRDGETAFTESLYAFSVITRQLTLKRLERESDGNDTL